jgi:hypothetical protein
MINRKNVLLVKDDVGKSKPATRDLPAEGFAFGKKVRADDEGVAIGKKINALN